MVFFNKKPKAGKYINRRGKSYTINANGSVSVDVDKLLRSEAAQKQLADVERLFKRLTLAALLKGIEPPLSVGVGTQTKKSLLTEWDDEWQTELDVFDITYEEFFDLPAEPVHGDWSHANDDFEKVGYSPVTADEIVKAYGKT